MRFWRKKSEPDASPGTNAPEASSTREPNRKPSGPPVKGTKVRLFLHPPGRVSRLLEVSLPDDPDASGVALRCFEPPPEGGGGAGDSPSKAWAVELGPNVVQDLRDQTANLRIAPLGGRSTQGDGSNVELTISAGPAEASLKWWMSAPSGWAAAGDLVETLRKLSGEEL